MKCNYCVKEVTVPCTEDSFLDCPNFEDVWKNVKPGPRTGLTLVHAQIRRPKLRKLGDAKSREKEIIVNQKMI